MVEAISPLAPIWEPVGMRVTPLCSKSGPALLLPTLPSLRTWVSLSCCSPLGPLGTPKSLNRYKYHDNSLQQVFLLTTSQLVSVFIFFLSGVLLHKKHVQLAQGSQIRGSGTRCLSSAARLQHRASPTKAWRLPLAVSQVWFLLNRPLYPCDNTCCWSMCRCPGQCFWLSQLFWGQEKALHVPWRCHTVQGVSRLPWVSDTKRLFSGELPMSWEWRLQETWG